MDLQEFQNPSSKWRGKPFWSWNGKLDKDELLRQIDVMKEMGMGGFFMHSRTGLETEYLGDEWFDLVNSCADYADAVGLEAWLYDEDRWPSGLAGGIVSKHPEFRQKAMLLEIDPEGRGEQVVAEFSCDLDGAVCTNLGSGKQVIRFSIVEQGKDGFYNGYTYIDTMNREATEAFLKSTHEKYAKKCGDRLGKSIKGIFTDEPHRGAVLDGFSMYRDDGAFCVPYTQKLFDEFEMRFGYDLKERLPELFFQVDGERISQVKWHYIELLQQLFIENFAIPCKTWCDQHNLILTGHILHEDNLTAQTAMSGSMMRYYEHMTSPGVDVLGEHNLNYWIVKQLTSAARQTGKTQLLSELYGCTGWEMPFAGHKAVGDWQALLGINLRCHHLSWYTMRGQAKRDYPASIFHQSAWYREYSYIEDYFARFGFMMAQGEPVCDLLVLNPVESLWAQVHLGWSEALDLKDSHLQKLEKHYQQLFTWLMSSQIDFDYGDEGMLAEMASVDGGTFNVGSAKYTTVLISGAESIRSSTLELLDQFTAAGGKVVVAGDAPTHVDAKRQAIQNSQFERIAFSKDAILATVPTAQAKVDASDIFGQLRKTDNGLIFAALNVNRKESAKETIVRIQTDNPVIEWNCETGEQIRIETEPSNGWQVFKTHFPKGGQKLWVAANARDFSPKLPVTISDVQHSKYIEGPFHYTLSEPNICVLDFAEYRIDDGTWQPLNEVLKIDQAVRDTHGSLRRGGAMLQPWFVAQQAVKDLCDVELRFSFEIATIPPWIDLVIEEPENFTVVLNGHEIDTTENEAWIDIALRRIRISVHTLFVGKNTITLKTAYKDNSNLEAIYLLGEFGLSLQGDQRCLVPMANTLSIGDIGPQGFPFYSGSILYTVPLPEGARKMRLPKIGGACAKVGDQILGWDPFEADLSSHDQEVEVEVILTRRNTFGPLHDRLGPHYWIHPKHYVTEGPAWSDACIFTPSGLLEPLELICTS